MAVGLGEQELEVKEEGGGERGREGGKRGGRRGRETDFIGNNRSLHVHASTPLGNEGDTHNDTN